VTTAIQKDQLMEFSKRTRGVTSVGALRPEELRDSSFGPAARLNGLKVPLLLPLLYSSYDALIIYQGVT
jgi:hypothetical protein